MIDVVIMAGSLGLAWKIASLEERTAWPWAVAVVLAQYFILTNMRIGSLYFFAALAPLAAEYGILWYLRAKDEGNNRNRPGGGIVR